MPPCCPNRHIGRKGYLFSFASHNHTTLCFYDGRGNSTIGTERLLKFFDETKTMAVITQRTLECSNFSDSGRACFFFFILLVISYSRFLTVVYVSLLQSASDDPHCGKRVADFAIGGNSNSSMYYFHSHKGCFMYAAQYGLCQV